MKIKARLFATLRNGRGKEIDLDLEEGSDVKKVIGNLNIHEEEAAILLVNGISSTLESMLSDGDTVSIFPPIGGG